MWRESALIHFILFLFQLGKSVKETKTVKCLKLGDAIKEPAAGTSCMVAGWGQTDEKADEFSDVLMSVNVTVVDRVKCNSPKYYNGRPVITRGMICAGSDGTNEADSCQVSNGECLFAGPSCQCLYCLSVIVVFSVGGFRRPTDVQRRTGWCHFFWRRVWPERQARSVLVSHSETTQLDQRHNEEVKDFVFATMLINSMWGDMREISASAAIKQAKLILFWNLNWRDTCLSWKQIAKGTLLSPSTRLMSTRQTHHFLHQEPKLKLRLQLKSFRKNLWQ